MAGFATTLSRRGREQALLRHSMLKAKLEALEQVKEPTDDQKGFARLLYASLLEIEELLSADEMLKKSRSKTNG